VDFGFAFNFTTSSTFISLCEDVVLGGCSGNAVVTTNVSGFIGAINDIPTPAALTSLWLGPQSSGAITLQSLDVANARSRAYTRRLHASTDWQRAYRDPVPSSAAAIKCCRLASANLGTVRTMSTGTVSASTSFAPENFTRASTPC